MEVIRKQSTPTFLKNEDFLPSGIYFEIRPFALLPTRCQNEESIIASYFCDNKHGVLRDRIALKEKTSG